MEITSAAQVLTGLSVSETNFQDAIRTANALHEEGMMQAQRNFRDQARMEMLLHRRKHDRSKFLHNTFMAHTLDIARREAVRDVWSQKNQLIQTLMIVDTMMFASVYSIVIQGTLPPDTDFILTMLFSIISSLSLCFLFASLWLTVKLEARMARYDMHEPKLVYACGRPHRDFRDYFRCHCYRVESVAFGSFYAGTALTVVVASVFFFSLMIGRFEGEFWIPGVIFATLCALGVKVPAVIGCCLSSRV